MPKSPYRLIQMILPARPRSKALDHIAFDIAWGEYIELALDCRIHRPTVAIDAISLDALCDLARKDNFPGTDLPRSMGCGDLAVNLSTGDVSLLTFDDWIKIEGDLRSKVQALLPPTDRGEINKAIDARIEAAIAEEAIADKAHKDYIDLEVLRAQAMTQSTV
jgi:hypothetical protein